MTESFGESSSTGSSSPREGSYRDENPIKMATRTLTNVMTPDTIALNAATFGFGGHSILTPHSRIARVWWTESKIEATVTPDFVLSKLRLDERELLHRPLEFGDGLTDDTYMDWIIERAKRLFLILAEIGVPDQIFGIIDDSWDDSDLPVQLGMVESLALSYRNDDKLNRRFYNTQYQYLLRELRPGVHIDYADEELVPLEYIHQLPPAVSLQNWPRVHAPKQPERSYMRRRFQLDADGKGKVSEDDFFSDLEVAKLITHPHIAPVYSSYTHQGSAYIITPLVGSHTLRTFIDHRTAPQYTRLSKPDRQVLLLQWMLCLADAIASLHGNGICHTAIRPSNILISPENRIAFSDIGSLRLFQADKKLDETELYDYGTPEEYPLAASLLLNPIDKKRSRKNSLSSQARSLSSKTNSSKGSSRTSAISGVSIPRSLALSTNFEDDLKIHHDFDPPQSPSTVSPSIISPSIAFTDISDPPLLNTHTMKQKSDIFSLGCVFLEILTFLLKRKTSEALKQRTTKVKQFSRGSARPDSSYHANLPKVYTWMESLEGFAFDMEDKVFRSIPSLMSLVKKMLNRAPEARPSASEARDEISRILRNHCGMENLYCDGWNQHDFGDGRTEEADEGPAESPTVCTGPAVQAALAVQSRRERTASRKIIREQEIRRQAKEDNEGQVWQKPMMTWVG